MPTLLDAAGVGVPDGIDGRSLLPLLRGKSSDWRDILHGECSDTGGGFDSPTGIQYLVTSPGECFDRRWKYAWFPGVGVEQLSDLDADPLERQNVANENPGALAALRSELVARLAHRPETFVENGDLASMNGITPPSLLAVDGSVR